MVRLHVLLLLAVALVGCSKSIEDMPALIDYETSLGLGGGASDWDYARARAHFGGAQVLLDGEVVGTVEPEDEMTSWGRVRYQARPSVGLSNPLDLKIRAQTVCGTSDLSFGGSDVAGLDVLVSRVESGKAQQTSRRLINSLKWRDVFIDWGSVGSGRLAIGGVEVSPGTTSVTVLAGDCERASVTFEGAEVGTWTPEGSVFVSLEDACHTYRVRGYGDASAARERTEHLSGRRVHILPNIGDEYTRLHHFLEPLPDEVKADRVGAFLSGVTREECPAELPAE